MKRLLLLLASIGSAFAAGQSIALSVSPAAVQPGGTATLTLTFTDSAPTANLAGMQWSLTLPSGITAGTPIVGAGAAAAAKLLTCGPSACILIGNGAPLNENLIASGVLASIPLNVSAAAISGSYSLSLAGVSGATAPGLAATIATSGLATLTVGSKYDLNGDGVVNAADVSIMLNQADGTTSTCTAPSTGVGDGKCGLADVELEILAAMGVIH